MIRTILFRMTWLLLIAALASCKYTVTKRKSPQLAVDDQTLSATIINLVKCEHINLNGTETTTNGHSTSELLVEIVNGINVPQAQNEQDSLNKKIAIEIKHDLKNGDQYDTYKVLFVDLQEKGNTTKTHYTGHIWNSKELK
jgi:hypothetical protein